MMADKHRTGIERSRKNGKGIISSLKRKDNGLTDSGNAGHKTRYRVKLRGDLFQMKCICLNFFRKS